MSTEKGTAKRRLSSEGASTGIDTANLDERQRKQQAHPKQHGTTETEEAADTHSAEEAEEGATQPASSGAVAEARASGGGSEESTVTGASPTMESSDSPRQVIAVSASKSPATFFNLARKFLVTNEMCDLSALEGAIVSAVDAAHLLERSQLATIVRIHTSYVTVEPKRRKHASNEGDQDAGIVQPSQPSTKGLAVGGEVAATSSSSTTTTMQQSSEAQVSGAESVASSAAASIVPASTAASQTARQGGTQRSSGGRELRRARIVVTVRRTESYKRWLEENPLQAIIAGEGDDDVVDSSIDPGPSSSSKDPPKAT